MRKITIILNIPEPIYTKLNSEAKQLHKKYGKYTTGSFPTDGKYYDIPHITLFSMGACYNKLPIIKKKLAMIAKRHPTMKLQTKKVILFTRGKICHLVTEFESNKELRELYKDVLTELLPISQYKKIEWKRYRPHASKILSLPKKLALRAKRDISIKEINFEGIHISIKVRKEDKQCFVYKKFELEQSTNKSTI